MKVVLFCGGFGLRIRTEEDSTPKPLVTIGNRPILWHLMKYYVHHGHNEFILCLGYKSAAIKDYFINHNGYISNYFVLSKGCTKIELLGEDMQEWSIILVETGLDSNIGQRLKAVAPYLRKEEVFMANYSDGLTDLPLDRHLEQFSRQNKIASLLCVRPRASFHEVTMNGNNVINKISRVNENGLLMNVGYFIFRKDIFDYINDGEELVEEPFQRLIEKQELVAYKYDGFWACMDTFKDKQILEELYSKSVAPWEVWKTS